MGPALPPRRTATVDETAVASAAVAAATVEQAAVVPTAVVVSAVAGSADCRGCGEHPQPVVTAAVAAEDMLDAMD